MTRGRRAPALLLLAASSLAAACSDEPAAGEDPRRAEGAALYATYCALCHGDQGQGYEAEAANAVTNQGFLAVATDTFLHESIARGRPATPMSAWGSDYGGPLSDAQVDAIRFFLRSFQAVPSVDTSAVPVGDGEPLRGQAVYDLYCLDCHGPEGAGGLYPSVAHPELLAFVDDGFLKYVTEHGRPGTPMPAFGADLTEQALDDVVALIRSWQTPGGGGGCELPTELGPPLPHPDGPEPPFSEGGSRYLDTATFLAAHQAESRMVVIDARAPCDYVSGHVPGAVSVPFYDVAKHAAALPEDAWIVTYCACPHAEADAAADALEAEGLTRIKVLDEGLPGYVEAGGALHEGPSP